MKYTVEWAKTKKEGETNGRAWKIIEMTLKDEAGVVTEEVSTFDPVTPGITIEGTIEMKGQYKNFKSTPVAPKQGGNAGYKTKMMEETMEKKSEHIRVAQDNKELGIKMSSTIRMAVDLAIASKQDFDGEVELKANVLEWRKWLWLEWDKKDTDYPAF